MDEFFDRLASRAATIDEVLAVAEAQGAAPVEHAAGVAPEAVSRRLDAWCRSSAAGDSELFKLRLARDGLDLDQVRRSFARVTPGGPPAWLADARWIDAALSTATPPERLGGDAFEKARRAYPFAALYLPLVAAAAARLRAELDPAAIARLADEAWNALCDHLLKAIAEFMAPAVYERFAQARDAGASDAPADDKLATSRHYVRFAAAMAASGFRRLFEDRPVLLRLLAVMTRQWIETSRELLTRLDRDSTLLHDTLVPANAGRVVEIAAELSDLHNGGRSVRVLTFESGARLVYKPKDLRLDLAWHALVKRLNASSPPIELRAVRVVARDGYGWTDYVAHDGCPDREACARFYRRAGAWLALLHVFAATDMHQENLIASGEHPVPIDLETILQPSPEEHKTNAPASAAFDAAMEVVGNSVMMVGLLPAYGRTADNQVFAMGGLIAERMARTVIVWNGLETDALRPIKTREVPDTLPNLPHIDGRYSPLDENVEALIGGFEAYARFLRHAAATLPGLLAAFAGLDVRKVVRPTRFYSMLVQRLKNHRSMDDGVIWSAQADFVSRLTDWDKTSDPLWPLHRAERDALCALNIPHFVTPSDGRSIGDARGPLATADAVPGLARAAERLAALNDKEIVWQAEVIRESMAKSPTAQPSAPVLEARREALQALMQADAAPFDFGTEADQIAAELAGLAIRHGTGAAWIGLDWLGDSDAFQLVCLGPDLYNGASGIAVFLAAHAAVRGNAQSAALALAALSHLRSQLQGANAARFARLLGTGGATGLGSVVYALTVIAKSLAGELGGDDVLADARRAALLMSDDVIAADRQLDVMAGSAGAILALLRLYRDTAWAPARERAMRCGEHLLAQERVGAVGRRMFIGQGLRAAGLTTPLNGMSHGAAGFALALGALAEVSGRADFAEAAAECIAYEDASFDAARHNWPDFRTTDAQAFPCQWCHGAPGIGLGRLALAKRGTLDAGRLRRDAREALDGTERGWPGAVDTLCCGTLGSIEFFCAAAAALDDPPLRHLAARRLQAVVQQANAAHDYRWNVGQRRFNLGLFRGLSGVGYTLLRQLDPTLPNVLVWD